MRHTYTCNVRWGDMDALGHVNNVRYADYLQEARVDLLRAHGGGAPTDALAEGTLVVSQHLDHVFPLVFDTEPVRIDVWVAEIKAATFTLAYEIYRDVDGTRTTYVRATTVLTPFSFVTERPRRVSAEERAQLETFLAPLELPRVDWTEPVLEELGHFAVHVRFSDLDVYGHANNVIYLEYFQEARIGMMTNHLRAFTGDGGATFPSMVVASQHVEYKRPMVLRSEPYDSWVWVARFGSASLTLQSQIRDLDGTVIARGQFVLVSVDPTSGASRPFDDTFRAAITVATS